MKENKSRKNTLHYCLSRCRDNQGWKGRGGRVESRERKANKGKAENGTHSWKGRMGNAECKRAM